MEQIKQLISPLLPIFLPLIFGGGFLAFLLKRLERRDAISDRNSLNNMDFADKSRFWEAAFRLSDGHGKWLAKLIGSTIVAYSEGNEERVKSYLQIKKESLGQEVDGKWEMNPYPDFVEIVRKDWDRVEGEEHGQ